MLFSSFVGGGPTQTEPDLEYDVPAGECPSTAVVSAVAAASGTPPDRLPALYDSVDPAALERLFDAQDSARSRGAVSFPYHGYHVTVRDGRTVSLHPASEK